MTAAPTRATVADRIAGTLLGAAIGDALGSAYEMLPNETIEQHLRSSFAREFEPAVRGSLLYRRDAAEPTDDTAMALSVAYTMASGESLTADVFARRFLADLDPAGGRFGRMFWNGGPGGATTQALRRLHMGADAATNGHPDDGGNGAAMRAHPIGCLPNRDDVLDVASVQARVTHGHPAAIAAAQTVAACIFDAIDGRAPSDDLPAGIIDATLIAAWNEAHRGLKRGHRLPVHLRNAAMSGWATVAAAHAIALLYLDDPEAAIGAAAASGGDTDTVASIVGAFVGARCGRSALPDRWVAGLSAGLVATCDDVTKSLVERRLHPGRPHPVTYDATKATPRVAMLCPRCTHRTICDRKTRRRATCARCAANLSIAVSLECRCGHTFRRHVTEHTVELPYRPRTLAGYLVIRTDDGIAEALANRALESLGRCNGCPCSGFRPE